MGKKKAKRSKKKKGALKKSDNVLEGIDGLPADGLLLALLLQGKKQSLSFYYGSYLDYKETLKTLRLRLHMIESSNYQVIKSIIKSSDEYSFQLLDLQKGKDHLLSSLDIDHDALVSLQRSEICELQQKIDELETIVEDLDDQIESIQQFQESNGFAILQTEMDKVKSDAEMAKETRLKHLEKITSRHEQGLFLSSQKVQKIIADMEAVACKTEFEKLPPKTTEKMIHNRLLKHQIEESKKEAENLDIQIRKLEDINFDYIFNGLEIDWNLMYNGTDQDDGCDYKFDYDDSISDESNVFSDNDSISEFSDNGRLISAFELPRKTLMNQRVYDVEDTAKKLTGLELQKRYNDIDHIGMKGKQLELKKPDLLAAGHLKFYDSKI